MSFLATIFMLSFVSYFGSNSSLGSCHEDCYCCSAFSAIMSTIDDEDSVDVCDYSEVLDAASTLNNVEGFMKVGIATLKAGGVAIPSFISIIPVAIDWKNYMMGGSTTGITKEQWDGLVTCIDTKIDEYNLQLLMSTVKSKANSYLAFMTQAKNNIDNNGFISDDTKEDFETLFEELSGVTGTFGIDTFIDTIQTRKAKKKALEYFAILVEVYWLISSTHLTITYNDYIDSGDYDSYNTDLDFFKGRIKKLHKWIFDYIHDEFTVSESQSSCYTSYYSGSQYGTTSQQTIKVKRSDGSKMGECGAFGGPGAGSRSWKCGDCDEDQAAAIASVKINPFTASETSDFRRKYYQFINDIKNKADSLFRINQVVCYNYPGSDQETDCEVYPQCPTGWVIVGEIYCGFSWSFFGIEQKKVFICLERICTTPYPAIGQQSEPKPIFYYNDSRITVITAGLMFFILINLIMVYYNYMRLNKN